MKNNIAAVDYDYAIFDKDEEFDCWVVEISVSGMATRIKIKCETQEFATSLHKKIADWLLS